MALLLGFGSGGEYTLAERRGRRRRLVFDRFGRSAPAAAVAAGIADVARFLGIDLEPAA